MPQFLYKLESLYRRLTPRWLFQPRFCWVYKLRLNRNLELVLDSPYEIRWAEEKDRLCLAERNALTNHRLAEGDRAVILLENDNLVGVLWIAIEHYQDWDTGLQIDLEDNQAWMYGAWVHRRLRGKKLYSQMIRFISHELTRHGQTEILFAIDWTNGLSQRIHRSYGAGRIGKLWGVEVMGWKWFLLKSQVELTTIQKTNKHPCDAEK